MLRDKEAFELYWCYVRRPMTKEMRYTVTAYLTTRVRISHPQRKPEPEEQPPLDRPDPKGMLLLEPAEETR